MPKRKNSDAPVWEHFTRYQESGNCVCHYCPKSYKLTAANSHSSLWYHVKNKHPNKMISSGNASESEQESTPKKKLCLSLSLSNELILHLYPIFLSISPILSLFLPCYLFSIPLSKIKIRRIKRNLKLYLISINYIYKMKKIIFYIYKKCWDIIANPRRCYKAQRM